MSEEKTTGNQGSEVPLLYVNAFELHAGPFDFMFDFGQKTPEQSKTKGYTLLARLAMSPIHAKLMHELLGTSIATYEKQVGEIPVPKPPPAPRQRGENRDHAD